MAIEIVLFTGFYFMVYFQISEIMRMERERRRKNFIVFAPFFTARLLPR
jgi:hypothetical protein